MVSANDPLRAPLLARLDEIEKRLAEFHALTDERERITAALAALDGRGRRPNAAVKPRSKRNLTGDRVTEDDVRAFVASNPGTNRAAIAKAFGIADATAGKRVNALLEAGAIKNTGGRKAGTRLEIV